MCFNGKLNTPDLRCEGFDNLMAYFQFKRRKHSENINERCKIVKYVVHDEEKSISLWVFLNSLLKLSDSVT